MSDTTHPGTPTSAGGDPLLALMCVTVILGAAGIAGLGILGGWWLLPIVLFSIIGMAIVVSFALTRLMGDDERL
jgi:hypothetical protein